MRTGDLATARWRTSSRSGAHEQTNCVEVAELADGVALRDSKDPAGPVLAVGHAEWRAFLGGLRTGQLR